MPKLRMTRLYYYGKTEARNADVYKLHQVKTLQNMLGTKKNLHAHSEGVFTSQVRDSCFVICMKTKTTER